MEERKMFHRNRWLVLIMIMAFLMLAACSDAAAIGGKSEPAIVEPIAGTEFNRVILTAKAAQRLGIELDSIREEQMNGKLEMVLPYAAILYGLNGETWAYTSPDTLTFVRSPITVDYIEGDNVVLVDGPPVGTDVVTVGVAELFGTDTGIGK
jgi:hypothetical protein